MSKHNGNFEVYGDIVVGANISGSKYILPHDKGDTGEALIMDGGIMIFANPAPYIDIAQTSGGADLVENVNQLMATILDLSGSVDNFVELFDTPKPALSVNAHEGEIIIVDPNASAQVQKITYSGVTIGDIMSDVASVSGDLQDQIDSITIASSGGSIVVSQSGLNWNLEVASAPIQNHNDLNALQGDGTDYFHLNAAQFASISGGVQSDVSYGTVNTDSILTKTYTIWGQITAGITSTLWYPPILNDFTTIKNDSTGITVISGGGMTIEGNDYISLYNGECVSILFDGSRWLITANGNADTNDEQWLVTPPISSSNSQGTKGQIAFDGVYRYECVSANTWVRYAVEWTF